MGNNNNNNHNDKWCSGLEIIKNCDMVEKPEVYVSKKAKEKIDALMDEFTNMEWLGYLVGDIKGKKHFVEDITIPEQEVSTASVKVIGPAPERCIGTVHSHHSMGAFTSSTDEEHLVGNHPVCIVVDNKKMISKVRMETPCKQLAVSEATIYSERSIDKQFVEESKAKIKERTCSVVPYNYKGMKDSVDEWMGNNYL